MSEEFLNVETREFAAIITKYNVSDSLGDQFLSYFQTHSNRSDNPLPKSTKILRKFLDNMEVKNLSFKSEVIYNDGKKDYVLYYRPIMEGIRELLSKKDLVNTEFYVDFKMYKVSILNYILKLTNNILIFIFF
ncbi:MAG TPA: hypothetical protein VN704_11005 [Verrucomicrobiae bacterium]|nr:hypothetical protein [Verrucomicrobiae bacterium]